jgi:hypothetical protein
MREGIDHADDALLRQIARQCAKCPNHYPEADACRCCDYNGAQYNGGDISRAKLMRLNCMPDPGSAERLAYYREQKAKYHDGNSNFLIGIAVVAAVLFGLMHWDMRRREALLPPQPKHFQSMFSEEPVKPAAAPVKPAPPKTQSAVNTTVAKVRQTLDQVHANIKDVNRDGTINCQDYAMMFHKYWPETDIMFNKHIGPTGHVFIRYTLPTGEGSYFIEPWYKGKDNKWTMKDVWPEWDRVRNDSIVATKHYLY